MRLDGGFLIKTKRFSWNRDPDGRILSKLLDFVAVLFHFQTRQAGLDLTFETLNQTALWFCVEPQRVLLGVALSDLNFAPKFRT